tara:strand:- start:4035 stop:5600 length:1566 start_codon:yes stop_codon:yes gene_type:complete
LAVHCDALASHPATYAKATWWRLCGKRLRARLTLAPLLGRSRWAYRLWLVSQPKADLSISSNIDRNEILALVAEGDGAEATLASLATEGLASKLVTRPSTYEAKWVLPLRAGDVLALGAGAAYAEAVAQADQATRLIYADDDLLTTGGLHRNPHFKPDWNRELFAHCDYLSGTALMRVTPEDFANLDGPDWIAKLTKRLARDCQDNDNAIVHLHQILHHRRTRPEADFPAPLAARLSDAASLPSVSVIVPTRNRLDLLRTCLDGLARTTYPQKLDIIVIDNGSDDPPTLEYLANLNPGFAKVLRDDGPFNFAALNNRAVEQASGEMLCFLNNDIEVGDPGWLMPMVQQASRGDVGAVGARLLYPDGRIQHAGVVLGIGGGAAHAHRLLDPAEAGYFHRHSLPQFTSAVTAACMVVAREKFLAIGGFDAEHFAVSFNDVDLCMRLAEHGWKSLYDPRATLVHHESVSRGFDRDAAGSARLASELAELQKRWGTRRGSTGDDTVDRYHHPALSRFSEHFVVDV